MRAPVVYMPGRIARNIEKRSTLDRLLVEQIKPGPFNRLVNCAKLLHREHHNKQDLGGSVSSPIDGSSGNENKENHSFMC